MKQRIIYLAAMLLCSTTALWADDDMARTFLTLEAIGDGTITFKNAAGVVYYRINGGEAQTLAAVTYDNNTGTYTTTATAFNVTAGDVVTFTCGSGTNLIGGSRVRCAFQYKDKNNTYKLAYSKIACTGDCYVYGNVMSLYSPDPEKFSTAKSMYVRNGSAATEQTDWGMAYLFFQNTHIKNHPTKKLLLPATTLTTYCYYAMFSGCTGLTEAPELPATTLQQNCYNTMFYNCTGLTESPEICATTLAAYSCQRMFKNCSNLSRVTCLATNVSASDCTTEWLSGVAATGTFVKALSMNKWNTGANGIPEGWTVEGPLTAYATYNSSTKTLTFKYDNYAPSGAYVVPETETTPGWSSYSNSTVRENTEHVVFDESFRNYRPKTCYQWFMGFASLQSISGWENLNTSEVTSMYGMFSGYKSPMALDLSHLDTSNVTDMRYMFNSSTCETIDVSSLNTSNVTNMGNMFSYCQNLTSLDLSNFDTGNVESIGSMFYHCFKLKSVNLTSFNTSKVTSLYGMFYNCYALESVDLRSFDTSNVTSFGGMFYGCQSLKTLDLSSFDTSKSTDFLWMFQGCSNLTLLDLTNFKITGTPTLSFMFASCSKLKAIFVDDAIWTVLDPNLSTNNMFDGCSSLVGEDGTTVGAVTDGTHAHTGAGGYLTKKYRTITAKAAKGAYWTTYYKSNVNRMADENTEVYTASLSGKKLTYHEVADHNIKAGQGVLLKSTQETITLANSVYEPTADYSANSLTGTDTEISNPAYGSTYVLSYKSSGLGFYLLGSGGTIGAGKAYLTYDGGGAHDFFLLEDDATGLKAVTDNAGPAAEGPVYSLDGRRVGQPTRRGVYITNGRKLVVR